MRKTLGITAGLTLAMVLAGQGYAQEVPPNGPFGGAAGERGREMRQHMGDRGGGNRGIGGNEMLFRFVQDPQMAKEIGLSDEKTKTLKAAFQKLQEKQIDLQAELAKLNLQQTGQVAGLLTDRNKNPDEALKLVEEMGKINTELSKLAIERILSIRENLTNEQIAKAREIAQDRMARMREEMMKREGREGGRPHEGGEGREGGKGRKRPERAPGE
jgi:hypothetical protein